MVNNSRIHPQLKVIIGNHQMSRFFLTILITLILQFTATAEPLKRDYHGFTLWLDCDTHHGALSFYYELGKDTGNIDRDNKKFKADPTLPASCQAKSKNSYRTKTVPPNTGTWDRGHLVPANHLDSDPGAFEDSFYLTNILPQASKFNQSAGAWFQTEIISECYRDITPLKIWGGVIWGNNAENDYFTKTHGIETPDFWWKLIYREDKQEYIAWIFPNDRSTQAKKIDDYLKSIEELTKRVDSLPALGPIKKAKQSEKSWPVKKSGRMLKCEGHSTSMG